MAEKDDSSVGSLNGKWAVLLKFALATYPMVVMWAVWASSEIVTITATRFDIRDGIALRTELVAKIRDHAADGHPQPWVRDQLTRLQDFHAP